MSPHLNQFSPRVTIGSAVVLVLMQMWDFFLARLRGIELAHLSYKNLRHLNDHKHQRTRYSADRSSERGIMLTEVRSQFNFEVTGRAR
jgi:hypothetical protein